MGDGQLLIRLTTTVSKNKKFCTLIWADNVKDNKNRLCSGIGSRADHPKKPRKSLSADKVLLKFKIKEQ